MEHLSLLWLLKPRVLHKELYQENVFRIQSKNSCIIMKKYINVILQDELKPASKSFGTDPQGNRIWLEYCRCIKHLEIIANSIIENTVTDTRGRSVWGTRSYRLSTRQKEHQESRRQRLKRLSCKFLSQLRCHYGAISGILVSLIFLLEQVSGFFFLTLGCISSACRLSTGPCGPGVRAGQQQVPVCDCDFKVCSFQRKSWWRNPAEKHTHCVSGRQLLQGDSKQEMVCHRPPFALFPVS